MALKYANFKSNFSSIDFNYKNTKKKKNYSRKNKIKCIFDHSLSVYDRLILFKNLQKDKPVKGGEKLNNKLLYTYLLNEYKKCFDYISFSQIVQSIQIFAELEKKCDDYDFFISVTDLDKNDLCKIREFEFSDKDLHFHRRELLGKICNKFIKQVHEMNGNDLINFIIFFYRWNKGDKRLIFFYNFYFNHVFDNLYLLNHNIYKVLFILNTYVTNNGSNMLFDKSLIKENEFNVCYFKELKKINNYAIKMSKEEIYNKCYLKVYENIDKIENNKMLNILKLYIDNSILNINIDEKIIKVLHKNLMNENIGYLIKLLKIYCTMIKAEKYNNTSIVSKSKEVILCILQNLKQKTGNENVLCDINYSALLNSINNKYILSKLADNNFSLFYELLLKSFFNIKFQNLQFLSISLISIKNIYSTLSKNKCYTNTSLFFSVMKMSLNMCNNLLENCVRMKNKNAIYIISHDKTIDNHVNSKDNNKEANVPKRSNSYFYKIENYDDFIFKLKVNDLLFIKILSNSFVKINKLYSSYDFYLLFNNISCILYYFIINNDVIKRFNDTHIYILNDLSFVYKNIKSESSDTNIILNNVKDLLYKNVLKVSNLYIQNMQEENKFLKEQYVCFLIFLNNLFFDRIIHFDYIKNIWCHVYNAYTYFKNNKMINEDIIALLLLTCSKFQFFIENNSNSRYSRKELLDLKYNIIDDLTINYLQKYKYISLDNLSKILISLSNLKYRYKIYEPLLLKTLENEIIRICPETPNNNFLDMSNYISSNINLENIRNEHIKQHIFINMSKIIECLIKLDIFLYLKEKHVFLSLFKNTFSNMYIKKNLLKKILYIANNLYLYNFYSYACNILEFFFGNEEISYNFNKNIENKVFEKIACFISEDDYIEISNTAFVFFYDYFQMINNEKYQTILNFPQKCTTNFGEIDHKDNTKRTDELLNYKKNTKQIEIDKDDIYKANLQNPINIYFETTDKCNEVQKDCNELTRNNKILKTNVRYNIIRDIMNLFRFLKVDRKKIILFQLYLYLSNIKKIKETNTTSSIFHLQVLSVLKNMNPKYLCVENYQIKNEQGTFLYIIDIVLFKANMFKKCSCF